MLATRALGFVADSTRKLIMTVNSVSCIERAQGRGRPTQLRLFSASSPHKGRAPRVMSLANARDSTPGCLLSLNVGSSQHVVLDCLSEGTRADLWVGAVEGACSLEQMVVIKQFHPEAAAAAWGRLVAELELARGLQSEHVVRTVDVCLEPSRCFQVSEYAEGSTLRACLSWAAAKRIALPNAVLARILWAILAAVTHAEREARSAWSRALV